MAKNSTALSAKVTLQPETEEFAAAHLKLCPTCDTLNQVPELKAGQKAFCHNCDKVLSTFKKEMVSRTLAFSISGLILLTVTLFLPIMDFTLGGQNSFNTLLNGVLGLFDSGFWWLSTLVLFCSVIFPLVQFFLLSAICLCVSFNRFTSRLAPMLKLQAWLSDWAMLDVYLLGIIVGFVKVSDFGGLLAEPGLWFFIVSLICMIGAVASFNPEQVWQRIESPPEPEAEKKQKLCLSCEYRLPVEADQCPRCYSTVRPYKHDAINRTWALTLTGMILLIPANILPVMNVTSFGRVEADTIASGIISLLNQGMLPIAILVFMASMVIPFLKLLSLTWILISIHWNKVDNPKQETLLYSAVSAIGRWSMLDLFMISILVALVNMGIIANVQADSGATAFASAVVITMLAAESFDPRLIWKKRQ